MEVKGHSLPPSHCNPYLPHSSLPQARGRGSTPPFPPSLALRGVVGLEPNTSLKIWAKGSIGRGKEGAAPSLSGNSRNFFPPPTLPPSCSHPPFGATLVP